MKKIMPTTYLLLLLALAVALHFAFPIKRVLSPPYSFLGVVLIFFGGVLNLQTDRLFNKDNTTVKPYETPSTLEETGPFRISRHPMYLGMTAILVGVAIVLGSIITFIMPVLFMMLMEKLFLHDEENKLAETFGEKYLDYKAKVRRWI